MSVNGASGHLSTPGLDWIHLFLPDPAGDPNVAMFDFLENGLDPGGVVRRRQVAESMYVDGAIEVQSSRGMAQANLGFLVTGRSHADLRVNIHALVKLVQRPRWHLHVAPHSDSAHYAWKCWASEPTVGFPVAWWYGVYAPVVISTLREPQAIRGPI